MVAVKTLVAFLVPAVQVLALRRPKIPSGGDSDDNGPTSCDDNESWIPSTSKCCPGLEHLDADGSDYCCVLKDGKDALNNGIIDYDTDCLAKVDVDDSDFDDKVDDAANGDSDDDNDDDDDDEGAASGPAGAAAGLILGMAGLHLVMAM